MREVPTLDNCLSTSSDPFLPGSDAAHPVSGGLQVIWRVTVPAVRPAVAWIGAENWLSTNIVRRHLTADGLDRYWDFEVCGESIFKAKFPDFQARGQSLVFDGYEPDWIHAICDSVELETGCISPVSTSSSSAEPECALPSVGVHIAYGASLAERMPEVAQMLSRIRFDAKT